MSLWCLVTAPLILSGDIARLDDFTLGLLTNDEVIEVDQDPLGQAARRVAKDGDLEIWAKDMEDGRKAVGLFNLDETQAVVTVKWSDLGIRGNQVIRDLWRQEDIGTFNGQFAAPVGEYGVVLVSLRPVGRQHLQSRGRSTSPRRPSTAPPSRINSNSCTVKL